MKPPPFRYADPATVAEAVSLIASEENAKVLAGGQSLMAMLNMRYVLPDVLVDLNGIPELSYMKLEGQTLAVGAMTRQRDLEFSADVKVRCPLMHEALLEVGHVQTRNRGTLGGSLCQLDPAAELVAVCMAMDATVSVAGPNGARDIPFAQFPMAYMTPSIELNEIVTGVRFPLWSAGHGSAFVEFARRHGDFAIVSAAALMECDANGAVTRCSLTIGGAGPAPARMSDVEKALVGQKPTAANLKDAAELCRKIEATGDVHAPMEYRQHLASVLGRRALEKAHARARPGAR